MLMDVNSQSLYVVRSWYLCDLPGLAFWSPNLILPVNPVLHPYLSARYEGLASTHRNTGKTRHCSLAFPDEETIEIFSTEIYPR